MTRQPSQHVVRLIILSGCLLLLSGCITRWPDAPYLDEVASLEPEAARVLEQKHPGAKLISPVYRRHMENSQGRYNVVARIYLFKDAAGSPHRGHVAENGDLTATAIEFIDTLPPALQDRFFDGPSAIVSGGKLNGKAWRFQDPQTGKNIFEFEFIQAAKRGLGRMSDADPSASAEIIRSDVNK